MSVRGSTTTLAALLLLGSAGGSAGESLRTSGQAVQNSVNALGYSLVAGTQLVFGVLAVPLGASAGLGQVSGEMSDAFWEVANTPADAPFPVADEAITAGPPPSDALRNGNRGPNGGTQP